MFYMVKTVIFSVTAMIIFHCDKVKGMRDSFLSFVSPW